MTIPAAGILITTPAKEALFLDNKYRRWYLALVSTEDRSGYVERHHIIPRCLGGDNRKSNIAKISARKHFLAHWLLTKITTGRAQIKMMHALVFMCGIGAKKRTLTSWQFERARKAAMDLKGEKNPRFGKSHSEESKRKSSESNKGQKRSDETRRNVSLSKMGNQAQLGLKRSDESRMRMSLAQTGKKHPPEVNAKKGRKQTAEQRAQKSERLKAYWSRKRAEQGLTIDQRGWNTSPIQG